MNLVLTICMGDEYSSIGELTHPFLKAYAKRIGADFRSITSQKVSQTTPHWEKFQISKLLDKYDRILYLDTDLIVKQDCPNLFDVVPEDKLGMFEEGQFTNRSRELLIDVCRNYGITLPGWNGKYYNSGVMVISQAHRNIFIKPEKEVCNFYEQSYLNMVISRDQVEIFGLEFKFNRMTCMDSFIGEHRLNAHIIHYAGWPDLAMVQGVIRQDIETLKYGEIDTRRHIYISVTGGLGDQICAEPAVRFMRKHLYPKDEMVVATHFPRLFKHLRKLGVEVCQQGMANLRNDTPYFIAESLPGPDKLQWSIVSHLLCHPVDYSSIALMKRTLPLVNKTINFEVDPQDHSDLFELTGIRDFMDFVVVHPGKHWETKTFPVEWWQTVIDGLVDTGEKVCVIGNNDRGAAVDTNVLGDRGTVNVACRGGVVDLREKTTLGMLGALFSQAKTLISNDSAPIHLAGAFDIEIVLIPSCKHPDHILPYREGTQLYKTLALYKNLIIDTVESRPTQVYPTSVDVKIMDWGKFLPSPGEVIRCL